MKTDKKESFGLDQSTENFPMFGLNLRANLTPLRKKKVLKKERRGKVGKSRKTDCSLNSCGVPG